ncbi:ThuA domain-containing protein [Herbiconiux sp. UC225_62]|uniref:ThuA domain-containing protein n=1 Tax=Herbiconiux sp. UC225_62 TaxID=3350168 RepID=UPI0036D227BD
MTRIVALAGDGEYESDRTMRPIAEGIAADIGASLDYRTPDVLEDYPEFPESSFGGLDTLERADLLLLYTRFRVLPEGEMRALESYFARGGNLVALRTSNHAFHPVVGRASADWAARFAAEVIGSPWSRHHGHSSTTTVTRLGEHPVLAHVPDRFSVTSWLYVTDPPADASVLLHGEPVNPETEPAPSAVAWARERGSQRIVYTSLGSQDDLEQPEVRLLLRNAARWCLGLPTPGTDR